MDYEEDPDYTAKMGPGRFKFKKFFFGMFVIILLFRQRIKNVEYFDRLKRSEQRAMNNTEVAEV